MKRKQKGETLSKIKGKVGGGGWASIPRGEKAESWQVPADPFLPAC